MASGHQEAQILEESAWVFPWMNSDRHLQNVDLFRRRSQAAAEGGRAGLSQTSRWIAGQPIPRAKHKRTRTRACRGSTRGDSRHGDPPIDTGPSPGRCFFPGQLLVIVPLLSHLD